MTIRKITEYPEQVLGLIGKPVTKFDEKLAELCEDMFETMYDDEGVGLAASQIGLNIRLFVMDCDGIKLIAANPEIIHKEGEQSGPEGCLSVGKFPLLCFGLKKLSCVLKMRKANGSNAKLKATPLVAFSTKPIIATANYSLIDYPRCGKICLSSDLRKKRTGNKN